MALSFMHSDRVEDVVELCFRCLDLNGDGEISKGSLQAAHRVCCVLLLISAGSTTLT
jgi:hypothetical protein